MTLNLKTSFAVMTIFFLITGASYAQTSDSIKVATVQERTETITLRMEKELALTKVQGAIKPGNESFG